MSNSGKQVIILPKKESKRDLKEPLDVDGTGYGGYPLKKTEVDLIGPCPPEEIVIFVHGWYLNENEAKERLDRVKMSLEVVKSTCTSNENEVN